MALIIADRVKETAAAPGSGQITLGGAVTGFRAFSAVCANGDTPYYAISDGGANWETGLGTFVSSGSKLTRTTVLASSNSGSAVNFTNPITVWCDAPAAKLPLLDASGNYTIPASLIFGGVTFTNATGSGKLVGQTSPTFAGTVTGPDGSIWNSTFLGGLLATTLACTTSTGNQTVRGITVTGNGIVAGMNHDDWWTLNIIDGNTSDFYFKFRYGAADVGSISGNGSNVAFNTSSDYRLKENVEPMGDALTRVLALKPSTFTWRTTKERSEGFLAHELQEVFPGAVTGLKDEVDGEGRPVIQGLDPRFLVAALVRSVQQLEARIAELESKV